MANSEQLKKQKEYEKYVKRVTPVHSLPLNMIKAFFTGGLICMSGQLLLNTAQSLGADKEEAGSWCSLILILISVILTGLNLYSKIGKFGGAGGLVPITGFANSVAASAIEFPGRRADLWYRLQDLYHCRTCDPLRNPQFLAGWMCLLYS